MKTAVDPREEFRAAEADLINDENAKVTKFFISAILFGLIKRQVHVPHIDNDVLGALVDIVEQLEDEKDEQGNNIMVFVDPNERGEAAAIKK